MDASTQAEDAAKSGDQTVSAGVSDYADYVGAKASGAADSSKAPITIGWVNQEGGPTDVGPGATKGADLAVKYLNEKLGGIDGHPVEAVQVLHLDVRGAGSDLRPEDGQQQGRQGHRHGRGRDR